MAENEEKLNDIGRPPILLEDGTPKYDIERMCELIDAYTDEALIPILKKICVEYHWDYDYVMKLQRIHERLRQSTKRLLDKKEVGLEENSLLGRVDKTVAIFSLKQLGWKDRVEIDQEKATIEKLDEVLNEFRKVAKSETD